MLSSFLATIESLVSTLLFAIVLCFRCAQFVNLLLESLHNNAIRLCEILSKEFLADPFDFGNV